MIYPAIYVGAIVSANLLIALFGPWWSPVNALLLIGMDLSLRDHLHEKFGVWVVGGLVLVAGALSWLLNPATLNIAVASAMAFTASSLLDTASFEALKGKRWLIRANGSNVVGAAVDSLLFPTLAFGVLMPWVVAAQFVAKVIGGLFFSFLLWRGRP